MLEKISKVTTEELINWIGSEINSIDAQMSQASNPTIRNALEGYKLTLDAASDLIFGLARKVVKKENH